MRLNIVRMRHWLWECIVCRFPEPSCSFPVWQQCCRTFTVGLTRAKHCGCTTHATSTPVLIWECGHTQKLLQAKQGCDLSPPHLYLRVLVTPNTDGMFGTMSSCPLLPGCWQAKECTWDGKMTYWSSPHSPPCRELFIQRDFPLGYFRRLQQRQGWSCSLTLTTKLPFNAHHLLTSTFHKHQQCVHSY